MKDEPIPPRVMEELRRQIRPGATKEQVLRVIDDVLLRLGINSQHLGLEAWKHLLTVAFSSARNTTTTGSNRWTSLPVAPETETKR